MSGYVSYYIASSGQPVNGLRWHSNKADAIKRAKDDLRGALLLRGGGVAVACTADAPEDRPYTVYYEWLEHAEGGYRTA